MILGLRWYGVLGAAIFLLATALMLLLYYGLIPLTGLTGPFYRQYYDFAWYGYILFADALVYRMKGRSLLSNRFGEFLLLLPLSFFVWEVYEAFDLRLENWYYVRMMPVASGGWEAVRVPYTHWNIPLYFIAFATVLPGEFLTLELIRTWPRRRNNAPHRARWTPFTLTQAKFDLFIFVGVACIILPLLWPREFFPLTWLWAFFIFDPINHRAGRPSILYELSQGRGGLLVQLLLAGFICGGFWETWNFWAGTKWVYTVPPPFDQLKIFEMPVLGFLGFPPFALECYAMYHYLRALPGIRRLARGRSHFAYGTSDAKEARPDGRSESVGQGVCPAH